MPEHETAPTVSIVDPDAVGDLWPAAEPGESPALYGHATLTPTGAFEVRSFQTLHDHLHRRALRAGRHRRDPRRAALHRRRRPAPDQRPAGHELRHRAVQQRHTARRQLRLRGAHAPLEPGPDGAGPGRLPARGGHDHHRPRRPRPRLARPAPADLLRGGARVQGPRRCLRHQTLRAAAAGHGDRRRARPARSLEGGIVNSAARRRGVRARDQGRGPLGQPLRPGDDDAPSRRVRPGARASRDGRFPHGPARLRGSPGCGRAGMYCARASSRTRRGNCWPRRIRSWCARPDYGPTGAICTARAARRSASTARGPTSPSPATSPSST